jgi:hypothetical protein
MSLDEAAGAESVRKPGAEARWTAGFAVAAVTVAVGYTLFTRHIWEDYFITFRHSVNLCAGHGLVFNPGERVHGFTSPLGVLLPAFCYLATGQGSYVPALWLFRAFSIAAYAGAGIVLLRTLRSDGEGRPAETLFLGALYLLSVTIVDYSINGMETGFVVLFVAWGFSLVVRGLSERWVELGLCWGALMWTRPDSVVYIAAFVVAALAFSREPRKVIATSVLKGGAVCAAVYLPWFAWAWWYYGSPIPHTVIAKSHIVMESGPLVQLKIILKETIDRYFVMAAQVFQPIYFKEGREWYPGLILASNALAVFSSCYWLLPVRERSGRMASLCFAVLCLYFTAMPAPYPWYFPPATMLGLAAVVRGVLTLADELRHRSPRSRRIAFLVLCGLCLERACLFGFTAVQMRIQQEEIETKTRTRIGLWLRDHVRPGERVYLEPLGYIGYFSGARIADWPGLASPEVVRLRREEKCDFGSIVAYLKPEWIVLRGGEFPLMSQSKYFVEHYAPVATFDARPRLQRHRWIPGKSYLESDSNFTIYEESRRLPVPHSG